MIQPTIGRPPEVIEQGVQFLKSDPVGSFGPWFMALLGTTFLLGILATQTTQYFSTFGFESWRIFTLVVSCVTLSTLQWIVIVMATWDWFVGHYGNWTRFARVPWQMCALEAITRFTVFVAQIFFARRCYTLYNQSRVVFAGIIIGMSASLVLFAMVTAMIAIDPYNLVILEKLMPAALCINLLTDVSITGLTLWKLARHSEQRLSRNTDDVLRRLRNVTAEAAVPPSVCALLNLILCFKWNNLAFQWFGIMTPRFYVCSLMLTLNSRAAIREKFNSPNQEDAENAEALSTGFEFAKFAITNRKRRCSDPDSSTFSISGLTPSGTLPRFPDTSTTADTEGRAEWQNRHGQLHSESRSDPGCGAGSDAQKLDTTR